jgi:hypothetical protein
MASNLYKVGYRRLLKSVNYAFQNDLRAIQLAKVRLREEFVQNRHVTDHQKLQQFEKDIEDVDIMLRFHIVQGQKSEKGSYGKVRQEMKYIITYESSIINIEVKFREEHMTAIEAGQDNPHGPELEPIDRGFIGQDVTVISSKKSTKPK